MMQNQFMSPHLHRNTSFLNSCYMEVDNFCISIELPHFHGPIQQQTTFTHIVHRIESLFCICYIGLDDFRTYTTSNKMHLLYRMASFLCIHYLESKHFHTFTTQNQIVLAHQLHGTRLFLYINYIESDNVLRIYYGEADPYCRYTTQLNISIQQNLTILHNYRELDHFCTSTTQRSIIFFYNIELHHLSTSNTQN